jgi:hypothetical protein
MIKRNSQLKADNLLKIPGVIEEINRHLWIESEKAGYDIGFERASQDWIERYAMIWLEYHMPSQPMRKDVSPRKTRKNKKSSI